MLSRGPYGTYIAHHRDLLMYTKFGANRIEIATCRVITYTHIQKNFPVAKGLTPLPLGLLVKKMAAKSCFSMLCYTFRSLSKKQSIELIFNQKTIFTFYVLV